MKTTRPLPHYDFAVDSGYSAARNGGGWRASL
jgi:hypothetical protein